MNEKQKKLRDVFRYECGFDPEDEVHKWPALNRGDALEVYRAAKDLLADEPESRRVSRENRLRALGFNDVHVNCAKNPGICPECWHVESVFDEDSEGGE